MSRPIFVVGMFVSLVAAAAMFPALAQNNEPKPPPDPSRKRIEALEKQLADKQRELDQLKVDHALDLGRANQVIVALDADRQSLLVMHAAIDRLFALFISKQAEDANQAAEQRALATRRIMQHLQTPIETRGLQERVKLKVALEYFSDKFGGQLIILVDKEAFANVNGKDSEDPYEEEIVLPPVPSKMLMSTALRMIIAQATKGQGTYAIRNGYVEILPEKYTTSPYYLYQPAITRTFEKRPLGEALKDLADDTGIAIDLDPNVADKARTPISGTYRNVSLEDALTPITEMAQLKYVVFHRTIFVTTQENAVVLEKEEAARRKKRDASPGATPAARARKLDKAAD